MVGTLLVKDMDSTFLTLQAIVQIQRFIAIVTSAKITTANNLKKKASRSEAFFL
jgi:hypothetical protein